MTAPIERASDRNAALARILFGLILAVNAVLKWTSPFRTHFLEDFDGGSENKNYLHGWLNFWHRLFAHDPYRWAVIIALIESVLAVAVLVGFIRKLTYIGGAVFMFMLWATAQGFGGPYWGDHADTDVGSALIYTIVFIMLLVLTVDKPDLLSVDYDIEPHVHWWHHVAEAEPPERV